MIDKQKEDKQKEAEAMIAEMTSGNLENFEHWATKSIYLMRKDMDSLEKSRDSAAATLDYLFQRIVEEYPIRAGLGRQIDQQQEALEDLKKFKRRTILSDRIGAAMVLVAIAMAWGLGLF